MEKIIMYALIVGAGLVIQWFKAQAKAKERAEKLQRRRTTMTPTQSDTGGESFEDVLKRIRAEQAAGTGQVPAPVAPRQSPNYTGPSSYDDVLEGPDVMPPLPRRQHSTLGKPGSGFGQERTSRTSTTSSGFGQERSNPVSGQRSGMGHTQTLKPRSIKEQPSAEMLALQELEKQRLAIMANLNNPLGTPKAGQTSASAKKPKRENRYKKLLNSPGGAKDAVITAMILERKYV